MVQEHDLRSRWLVGIRPHEDVARVSVTVDMPVHKDHLSEYLEQHICACFSASKLLVQALDIVNFDSFDILHQDGPLRTLKDIYFRNV